MSSCWAAVSRTSSACTRRCRASCRAMCTRRRSTRRSCAPSTATRAAYAAPRCYGASRLVERRLRRRAGINRRCFLDRRLPAGNERIEVLLHRFAVADDAVHEAHALRVAVDGFAVPWALRPGTRARRVAAIHAGIEGVRGRDELPSLGSRDVGGDQYRHGELDVLPGEPGCRVFPQTLRARPEI